ncbi:MAG: PilN domain-containing protein [gamma proteobacterium symbiont of Taylorina sp.]|nr:PilN domain-containing protein [gamma proteobacterium symbiont of Taylorina sp.]
MLQQVNLYQPEDNIKREPFSALLMLIISIVTLLLMLGLYALLFWKTQALGTEITSLKSQYEHNLTAVAKLETLAGKLADTKKERAQLNALNNRYKDKQAALSELSSLIKGNSKGLSDYFSALAKKNIEAIWFTEINIFNGGQQLRLKGKAKAAHYIPQFIALLKEEAVFSGVNFKLFNAQLNKKDGLVDFSLQTGLESTTENL